MSDLPSDAALQDLSRLAHRLEQLDEIIEREEERIGSLKKDRDALARGTIPDRMAELGLSSISLANGKRLTIITIVSAKSTPEILEWLEKNGAGDLIKTEVRGLFGRGQLDEVPNAIAALEGLNAIVEEKRSVHTSTLKAFFREWVEEKGRAAPESVFVGPMAQLK